MCFNIFHTQKSVSDHSIMLLKWSLNGRDTFRIKNVHKAAQVTLCLHKINKTKTPVMAKQRKLINKENEKYTFYITE